MTRRVRTFLSLVAAATYAGLTIRPLRNDSEKSSVVVTARYTRIGWFAFAVRSGEALRSGHVRGISPARAS